MTPAARTRAIIAEVAERHGVTMEGIMSDSHKRHLAWPRQEAFYEVAKQRRWMSYPQIASVFNRDHTTIIFGVRRHCKRNGISYAAFMKYRTGSYWLTGQQADRAMAA
jgi:chromosomal replication initiation ATPase DnaA